MARDKGRIAIVTNRGLGCDGRDGGGRGWHCTAALAVSNCLRANDTTPTASSHGREGEHTPTFEDAREDVRGRRSRVVLTSGVCASSLAVMCVAQPGARVSHPKGDGGNSASLPEESTKDTVKTIRAGKAGRSGETCGPPRVHFCRARTCGCQPAPGLPCALVFIRALHTGGATEQNSGETHRENVDSRPLFETCIGATLSLAPLSLSSPALCALAHWGGRSSTPRRL
ncbi:hypothetical protein FXV83_32885 [Bradyrhizobium hipponense]|uniref:Uncharacterized protein n=1 Tax=Bradyrhizobium hipponense TaxID=2605638 RepID=A0A5S4YEH3_9BRAD|nr:hypothetical protein FXV83_32885 [Bradyrhizobium hipponense]